MRLFLAVLSVALMCCGCQQQMAKQPSYRPLQPSEFFDDGRSARPLVAGTVPYSAEPDRPALATGRVPNADSMQEPLKEYVTVFPFPITKQDLLRGKERFTIFCSVCHDAAGTGHGKIVERGYTMPPSYHTSFSRGLERRGVKVPLRDAPVGYFFEVITNGYGAMPDYATQVPPEDRWRIIAYIRALQYSRHVPLDDLTEEERKKTAGQ
jgi:mono/diheme cytochrome c family protein